VTPEQTFLLEIGKLLLEALKIVGPLAAAYFANKALNAANRTSKEVGTLSTKQGELAKSVDGMKDELVSKSERAAHAEGKVEVLEGVAEKVNAQPAIVPVVVQTPPRDPSARTRAEDRQRVNPPPPEHDPGSHLP
jgi:hypothetical protein